MDNDDWGSQKGLYSGGSGEDIRSKRSLADEGNNGGLCKRNENQCESIDKEEKNNLLVVEVVVNIEEWRPSVALIVELDETFLLVVEPKNRSFD